jgi:hypothetical protein
LFCNTSFKILIKTAGDISEGGGEGERGRGRVGEEERGRVGEWGRGRIPNSQFPTINYQLSTLPSSFN